jgi:subtilase family serine protease
MMLFGAFNSGCAPSLRFRISSFVHKLAVTPVARTMPKVLAFAAAALALVSMTGVDSQAQAYRGGLKARSLVTGAIEENQRVTLFGSTHPEAIAANDRGLAPDNMPMENMQLVLQRPPELEKELVDLIEEMQRKDSKLYHHWLTPQEFGERFGVSPKDIATVSGWLKSNGFRVDSVAPSGMFIEFSGTAGQVKQAFRTEIHNLEVDGERHFANLSAPQIPAALAGVVKGPHALHNFMPHSLMMKRSPDFNTVLGSTTYYAVAPADMATIYNLNPAFSAGFTGTGQTVVVIEDTLLANPSDVATFRTAFGLSKYPGTFSQITATGTTTCNN